MSDTFDEWWNSKADLKNPAYRTERDRCIAEISWKAARAGHVSKQTVMDILRAEFAYWLDGRDDDNAGISIGACGAVSTVMAALYGWPAEWHPGGRTPRPFHFVQLIKDGSD